MTNFSLPALDALDDVDSIDEIGNSTRLRALAEYFRKHPEDLADFLLDHPVAVNGILNYLTDPLHSDPGLLARSLTSGLLISSSKLLEQLVERAKEARHARAS